MKATAGQSITTCECEALEKKSPSNSNNNIYIWEGSYQSLAADILTRKNDNLFNDTTLRVNEMEAVFKVNEQEDSPYVVCDYQVQQIDCWG
jgi:hypothetical protein